MLKRLFFIALLFIPCAGMMKAVGNRNLLSLQSNISKGNSLNVESGQTNGIVVSESGDGFPVVNGENTATIVVDDNEKEVVHTVAKALASDIFLVTNAKVAISSNFSESNNIVVGTIGKSKYIQQLIDKGLISAAAVEGKWETFCLTNVIVDGKKTLVIYGSDPRGTSFGMFELSRAMGVTPYVWWADVTPAHKDNLFVATNGNVVGPPSVKYRGLFINDEDWGLKPWAAKNMDKDVKDIGPKTYEKVCELLLRLKGNYLWPAMHPCTKAFWYYKENPVVARRYDIVLGSSHCEPLLRNNVDEWKNNFTSEYGHAPGSWNWATNKAEVMQYWTDRVAESKNNDAIYTIGMRGIHDSGMPGYKTDKDKQAALKDVIKEQRNILSTQLGKDASLVPQLFCPYKEALTLYRMGLDMPDDVTLLWPDDNFGYIRQLSNPNEQKRIGGGGVYYHFSYWGVPYDHLWLSSVSPTLTSFELNKAYNTNDKNIWIFNVGDIKPQEAELQFAMDLAWDVEKWSPEKAYSYTQYWAEEYFGSDLATDIANVKNEYYRLAAAGKPEHVHAISYTRREVEKRLNDYIKLEQNTEALLGRIPSRLYNAFWEMVYYPILGAANINKKVLYAKMSYFAASDGNKSGIKEYSTKSLQAYEKIVSLTNRYNKEIADGKWDGIMDYAPRGLKYFYEASVATESSASQNPIKASETPVVTINASDYTKCGNSNNIKSIQGLGISDNSVSVLPLNMTAYSQQDITSAPWVEYEVPINKGNNTITVKCLPTFPLYQGYKLRFATQLGSATPIFHDITMEAEKQPWSTNVVTGYSAATISYNSATQETVTLRVFLADPGITISEIEVNQAAINELDVLVNPGFEYKAEGVLNNGVVTRGDPWGWKRVGTLKGNSWGISSDATNFEGKSICWYNSTPMPKEFELYQIASDIKPGKYIVRCKLGVFEGTATNQRLFANNNVQYYGKESDYNKNIVDGENATFAGHSWGIKGGSKGELKEMLVHVTINEGETLKVGIRSSNKLSNGAQAKDNAGWFKVDDFRIEPDKEDGSGVVKDPNDYTDKIVNSDFEYQKEGVVNDGNTFRGTPWGWKHEGNILGNSYGINNDGTGIEGKNLCWYNSFPMPESFCLSQKLTNLPPGHYTVSCKLACNKGAITNQRLFANNYVQYFGNEADYSLNLSDNELPSWAGWTPADNLLKPMSLDLYLFPGEDLILGIRSGNQYGDGTRELKNNAGWFKVDHFELYYHGNEISDFVSHVEDLLTSARKLNSYVMDTNIKQQLENSIISGEKCNRQDIESLHSCTSALISCMAKARLSSAQYAKIDKLLNDAVIRVGELKTPYDNETFNAEIDAIRDAYSNGKLDFSNDYQAIVDGLVNNAIISSVVITGDATFLIKNPNIDATTKDGWLRENNSAKGYSEKPDAIQSDVHNGYGISHWRGSAIKDSKLIYQTIESLPKGHYRLTAYAAATVWNDGDGNANKPGVYVFANDSKTEVTTAKYGEYSVDFELNEAGSVTLGLMAQGNQGNNWCFLSDVKLLYLDKQIQYSLGNSGYGTLILPYDAVLPSGVKAYTCKSLNGDVVVTEQQTSIPANTPLLIKGVPGNYTFTGVSQATEKSYTSGLLTGELEATKVTNGYVLQEQDGAVAFYRVEADKPINVPAYRCYLTVPSASKYLSIDFENATGISNLNLGGKTNVVYDLSGRRIDGKLQGHRRIVIVNNKKVVK